MGDITKLSAEWREEELKAPPFEIMLSGDDCADQLDAALPKWTKITDGLPQNLAIVAVYSAETHFYAMFYAKEKEWAVFDGLFYLTKVPVSEYDRYRSLCSIDYPPTEAEAKS